METREDIELETAILTRDRTKAEIAKLEAETRSLEGPRGFVERNWAQLLTAGAALVAGLGGLAALLTVIVQIFQLPFTEPQELLDAHKSAVDAITMEAVANKNSRDAQNQAAAAMIDLKKATAEQQQLAAEKKATLRQLASAHDALLQYQSVDADQQREAEGKGGVTATALKVLTAVAGGAGAKGQVVDIQYADRDSADAMVSVRSLLARDGYDPSDPELLQASEFGTSRPNEVRYFGGPEMQKTAMDLADKVNTYLGPLCPGHPRVVAYWHYPNADAPKSLLELWIKSPCRSAEKLRHA